MPRGSFMSRPADFGQPADAQVDQFATWSMPENLRSLTLDPLNPCRNLNPARNLLSNRNRRRNLNRSPGSKLILTPRATHPSRARVSEQMSESERNADDHTSGRTPHRRPRLMGRAMREKWAIPGSLRLPLVERAGRDCPRSGGPASRRPIGGQRHPDGQQDQPGEYRVEHQGSEARGIGRARDGDRA